MGMHFTVFSVYERYHPVHISTLEAWKVLYSNIAGTMGCLSFILSSISALVEYPRFVFYLPEDQDPQTVFLQAAAEN